MPGSNPRPMSLIWPALVIPGDNQEYHRISPNSWHDLGLDAIVNSFANDVEHRRELERIFSDLCQDIEVVRFRQAILNDLMENHLLVQRLEKLLPIIDALGRFSYRVVKDLNTLHEITWRIGELQSVVDCIHGLQMAFEEAGDLSSEGLKGLSRLAREIWEDPAFQNLAQELPEILSQLRACKSVTIGVNLDQYLRPVEATLLSVNEENFTNQSMLNRLFGLNAGKEGIAALHTVPKRGVDGPYALPISSELGWAAEPLMVPLFKDLADVIEKITLPIARRLKQYSEIKSKLFINLRQDLIFYLGALRFIGRMKASGLPVVLPEILPAEAGECRIKNSYNANLALHLIEKSGGGEISQMLTLNDITMGDPGRIFILTGPNQGGKTTFMQGVAIAQVLAQVGLAVPGTSAHISLVDNIFTHFPIEEKPEVDTGRFGEEAQRLNEIFQAVSRNSLVLLNESLSSTSAGESLYLAQDVVRMLRRIGVRAIYSTHLHELAEHADELNLDTPGDSKIVSIVSSPVVAGSPSAENGTRSFRIEARPPLGRSYAEEIAARYGISYQQIEELLKSRGVL